MTENRSHEGRLKRIRGLLTEEGRLALSLFFLLFVAGRIGLLLHEFAGHALACRLLGGRITGYRLFLFGGGWVHYGPNPAIDNALLSTLALQLSGIAVELAAGAILAVIIHFRWVRPFTERLIAATAGVLIVHSLFYFSISTYYGSGDGRMLHALLPADARIACVVLAGSLTVFGAFRVACAFSPVVRGWVAARDSRRQFVRFAAATSVALLLHGGLTAGERMLVNDSRYAEIQRPMAERRLSDDLSKFVEDYRNATGRKPRPEVIAALRRALEAKYRPFPIDILLGLLVVNAFAAGWILSLRRDPGGGTPIAWSDAGRLGACAAAAAALVVLL